MSCSSRSSSFRRLAGLQVANNPLNFSKPCLLSTSRFPIESVFLQVNSNFSAAVFGAQKQCIMATTQANCTERKANISSSALQDSMLYKASETPSQPPAGDAAAVAKSAAAAGDGSNTFVASWAQMGPSALLHLGDTAAGSHENSAVAAKNGSIKDAPKHTASQGEQLEGGVAAESITASEVTAPLAIASRKKIVRESAETLAPLRASWANNLQIPPLLSTLASLAAPRSLPTFPVPTASGPFSIPQPQLAAPLLPGSTMPKLPLLSSNGTGSGCTTIATCRAAFVSLKKLRVIVETAPAVSIGQILPADKPLVPLV
jgi:hypothetical protein